MLVVGLVISELTTRLRRQERAAAAREERTAVLYALSKELSSADNTQMIAAIAARHASDSFAAPCAILIGDGDKRLSPVGTHPIGTHLDSKDEVVAQWSLEHSMLAGNGTDTLTGASSLCSPLRVGSSTLGVLALIQAGRETLRVEQREFLEVFSRQVAISLERVRLAEEARAAAMRVRAEEMRSSLLSTVSHDLRTPLACITGAATSMRDDTNLDDVVRMDLVRTICDEAERLELLVANLLDMTRLESGALSLKRDWIPIDEIIGPALVRAESKLQNRSLRVSIPDDVPLVLVDPVLVSQIFVNLLENACKYTPDGTAIEVTAAKGEDAVEIDVRDHGPGIPEGHEQKVFEKFYRGAHVGVPGAGLGLPICRAIAEAHGGTVSAERAAGGGLRMRVVVPIGGQPPESSGLGEELEV
jgi:two-component system sensor histidine kinase KdpD